MIASTSAISTHAAVRLTYMSQPAMVAALETGAVQGFIISAPYYGISALKGTGVMWVSGPKGEFRFLPSWPRLDASALFLWHAVDVGFLLPNGTRRAEAQPDGTPGVW